MAKPARTRRPADPIRLAAANILVHWQTGRESPDALVARFESEPEGSAAAYDARRRLRELVFGSVRWKGRYDHLVAATLRSPRAPDPRLRAVLWLGLHELIELRTPDYAAVDAAVDMCAPLGIGHAAGAVNAVLRRILREGAETFFPAADASPVDYASQWLSHPRWMVERWSQRLPEGELLALCEANNRRPPLDLRASGTDREQLLSRLGQLEWRAEKLPYASSGVRLLERVPAPVALVALEDDVVFQDQAAQLIAPLLLRSQPSRVLDLCAAPGGKATHVADLLVGRGHVVAVDTSPSRTRRLVENRERLGLHNLHLVVADGVSPPFVPGRFDAVLVDAPCTGTGVLSRRHDARWRKHPQDLERMSALQRGLLRSAVDLCRPGGMIVYATCSLELEENDEVVEAVLSERADLVEQGAGDALPAEVLDGLRLRVWPHRHGSDGAFAAVLRRKEDL